MTVDTPRSPVPAGALDGLAGQIGHAADTLVSDPGRASLLRSGPLGHALHPMLTDVTIGGKTVATGSVLDLTDGILDALVEDEKGFLKKSVAPLIANINNQYVGPVARMLGIRLGGADVFAVGATCGQPRLVG